MNTINVMFDEFKCFTSYEEFCTEFEKVSKYPDYRTELTLTFDRLWSDTGNFNDMLDFISGFYPLIRILVVKINYFYHYDEKTCCYLHIPKGIEELWLIGNQQMEYYFTETNTNNLVLLVTETDQVHIPTNLTYNYLDLLNNSDALNNHKKSPLPNYLIEKIKKYEYGYFCFMDDISIRPYTDFSYYSS